MPRLILRVTDVVGARRNSLSLKQADALYPSTSAMLSAGQRDLKTNTNFRYLASPIEFPAMVTQLAYGADDECGTLKESFKAGS